MTVHSPPPQDAEYRREFQYKSLAHPEGTGATLRQVNPNVESAATIYRGMVPALNILEHDFAINGAAVSHIIRDDSQFS